METTETWKQVEGFDSFYEVSDMGNVRSLDRIIHHPVLGSFIRFGRKISKTLDSHGYHLCRLSVDKKRAIKIVHRLVAQAFIPNPENKKCVNHKNKIKTDNRVQNLEWVTYSENMFHAYKGCPPKRTLRGQNHLSRLTKEQRAEIFSSSKSNPLNDIAEKYGVTRRIIRNSIAWSKSQSRETLYEK